MYIRLISLICIVMLYQLALMLLNVQPRTNCVPWWKEHVDKLMKESLYWHRCWKAQGSPHLDDIVQIRKITRARYHHAIKTVKMKEDKI